MMLRETLSCAIENDSAGLGTCPTTVYREKFPLLRNCWNTFVSGAHRSDVLVTSAHDRALVEGAASLTRLTKPADRYARRRRRERETDVYSHSRVAEFLFLLTPENIVVASLSLPCLRRIWSRDIPKCTVKCLCSIRCDRRHRSRARRPTPSASSIDIPEHRLPTSTTETPRGLALGSSKKNKRTRTAVTLRTTWSRSAFTKWCSPEDLAAAKLPDRCGSARSSRTWDGSGGIKFSDLNAEEGFKFQENLLRTMIQIENTFFQLGESCSRNCLIICDRGAMDASAFISKDKWELMMASNGWNNVELRDNRYNQIIHMVSAANGAEDFYSTEDHACRSEGVELARELDYKAAAAWVGHPYFDVIDNSQDFESKICRMIECVCQKLGIDTGDRLRDSSRKVKFLIKGPLPADTEFPPFQDFDVVHNYLQSNNPKMQARLRKRGQKGHWSYIHTIRRPKMCGQVIEVKTQLTHRDYLNMLAQRDDSHFTIFKRRRCFLINNQYFQLDIYREPAHPRCRGLMLLETYTALSGDELKNILPQFLTIEKEVTGNPDYSMFNLSLREEWNSTNKYCHNLHDYALAGLTECGSAECKNISSPEMKDSTSSKKRVNGFDTRVNGVEVGVNGIDKVVNGVQNGNHGVVNGNAKFVGRSSVQSNSEGDKTRVECGSPAK